MKRTIYDLDTIVERLSLEDPAEAVESTFDPDKDAREAVSEFNDAIFAASMRCTDLEDAAVRYATSSEIAGFSRGFRAGARLILQLLQVEAVSEA